MTYYPPEVFSINETRTQLNMAEYDRRKKLFDRKTRELFPNYDKLTLRGRYEASKKTEEVLGWRP